jgi:hypothetical protein
MIDGAPCKLLATVALSILAGARPFRVSSAAPSPAPSLASAQANKSTAAVLDELIERTNKMEAFAADYRVLDSKKQGVMHMHLAYKRGRGIAWSMEAGESSSKIWAVDGKVAMRMSGGAGPPKQLNVDYKELILVPKDALDDQLEAEFPKIARRQSRASEGDAAFSFNYRKDAEPGSQFTLGAGFEFGKTLLGWLQWLKVNAPPVKEHGDTLTFDLDEGVHLDLSKESGFISAIRKMENGAEVTSFALEKLDSDPSFEKSEFVIPSAAAGTVDVSDETIAGLAGRSIQEESEFLCSRIASHVADKSLAWNDESRAKVARVFATLHRQNIGFVHRAQVEVLEKRVEEFGTSLTAQYARRAEDGGEWRGALEKQIDEWVQGLKSGMEKGRDAYVARMSRLPELAAPEELRRELESMLEDAARKSFETEIMQPILEKLDAKIAEVKSAAGGAPRPKK